MNRHIQTQFISIERQDCDACWKCVETCPEHVLRKVAFFNHRHVRVHRAEACKGCKKCVRICSTGAIHWIYIRPDRSNESLQALAAP